MLIVAGSQVALCGTPSPCQKASVLSANQSQGEEQSTTMHSSNTPLSVLSAAPVLAGWQIPCIHPWSCLHSKGISPVYVPVSLHLKPQLCFHVGTVL